jgi:hypothetical protein
MSAGNPWPAGAVSTAAPTASVMWVRLRIEISKRRSSFDAMWWYSDAR